MSDLDMDCLTMDKDVAILDNVTNILYLSLTTTFGLSLQLWKSTAKPLSNELDQSGNDRLVWCCAFGVQHGQAKRKTNRKTCSPVIII